MNYRDTRLPILKEDIVYVRVRMGGIVIFKYTLLAEQEKQSTPFANVHVLYMHNFGTVRFKLESTSSTSTKDRNPESKHCEPPAPV